MPSPYFCDSPTSPPEKLPRQDTPIPGQDLQFSIAPPNAKPTNRSVFKDFQTTENNQSTPFRRGNEPTQQQTLNIVQTQENNTQLVLECLDELSVKFTEFGNFAAMRFNDIDTWHDQSFTSLNEIKRKATSTSSRLTAISERCEVNTTIMSDQMEQLKNHSMLHRETLRNLKENKKIISENNLHTFHWPLLFS